MHENTDGLTSHQTLLGLSVYTRSKRQVSLHTLPVVGKLLFDHEPSYLSHYAWSRSKRRKLPDLWLESWKGILDINPTTGGQTPDQLRSEFPPFAVSFEECDVFPGKSQAAVFEKIHAQQGWIDLVFVNADIIGKGSAALAERTRQ